MPKQADEMLIERNFALGEMRMMLRNCEQKMSFIIAATPTGTDRNALTEINIDLMRIQDKYVSVVSSILNKLSGTY